MEQFGCYFLEEWLVRGSMGEVYRARHNETGAVVALERLPGWVEEREREALERRLLAEARCTHDLDDDGDDPRDAILTSRSWCP